MLFDYATEIESYRDQRAFNGRAVEAEDNPPRRPGG